MCELIRNWNRVKVLAYLELILTVTTVYIIGHAYIINRDILGEIEFKLSQNVEPELQPDTPNPDESRYRKYIGRGLVFLGASGMIGIFFCVILIITGKFKNFTYVGKRRTLGLWFGLNVLNVIIMTFLWGGIIFFVASGNVRVSTGVDTQVPYGACYICRIVLVFVIRKMKKSVSDENESLDGIDMEK